MKRRQYVVRTEKTKIGHMLVTMQNSKGELLEAETTITDLDFMSMSKKADMVAEENDCKVVGYRIDRIEVKSLKRRMTLEKFIQNSEVF